MTRGFPKPNIPLLSVKRILYYIMLYIVYIIKVDKVIIFCLNLYICIYMYDESILCYNTLIHTPKENDENVDMNKKCCAVIVLLVFFINVRCMIWYAYILI